jgi:hypothetical protein
MDGGQRLLGPANRLQSAMVSGQDRRWVSHHRPLKKEPPVDARIVRLFVSLALLLPALAHTQERKAITHEDLWLMPRVGAPAVSPDGRFAVFSVVEPTCGWWPRTVNQHRAA